MGSEQSSQPNQASQARSRTGQLRRGKSVPEQKRSDQENLDGSRPGSISPGPSICSDSDLPYISYTVNRPIGGKFLLRASLQLITVLNVIFIIWCDLSMLQSF